MFILVDARMPGKALEKLSSFGQPLCLSTHGITYDSIAGHPDIFFCQIPGGLVATPNIPEYYLVRLTKTGIRLTTGIKPITYAYPGSASYNAFVNDQYIVHHKEYSEKAIRQSCPDLSFLHVKQGYSRCNLAEAGGLYMTSDKGIEKVLIAEGLDVYYIDPRSIILPGEDHGFFGGCTGKWQSRLFLTGSCSFFPEGPELRTELNKRGIEVIELVDGPLWDAGSIIFSGQSDVKI